MSTILWRSLYCSTTMPMDKYSRFSDLAPHVLRHCKHAKRHVIQVARLFRSSSIQIIKLALRYGSFLAPLAVVSPSSKVDVETP